MPKLGVVSKSDKQSQAFITDHGMDAKVINNTKQLFGLGLHDVDVLLLLLPGFESNQIYSSVAFKHLCTVGRCEVVDECELPF